MKGKLKYALASLILIMHSCTTVISAPRDTIETDCETVFKPIATPTIKTVRF